MGSSGVLKEIEKALINGESRESLNKKYNKASVTRVYNRLKKEGNIKINESNEDNEKELEKLLKEALNLINNERKYEITISVKKKIDNINNSNGEILNPFKLYDELNRESMANELKEKDRNYLIKIIKKYFNYNSKLLKGYTNEQLAVYIRSEVEKVLSIGSCFK
ncbi:hypothetical protein [Clostridium ganghwense]|uniref:Uncharacterized protein n=1 Tax=Clostridium ganghwense TaxID=312089 RepID=A0ABT4CK21_9CLOT|nr:hypothetical protein [Clostridium ganghwense]MCY6369402.1 hypothetical protein [Clostridium ganghwense]